MVETIPTEADDALEAIAVLAHESTETDLYPEGYDWYEVRRLVFDVAEAFKESGGSLDDLAADYQRLHGETSLSEREAEVVALKRHDMTHEAIAWFYGVLDHETGGVSYPTSASTVDEYSRRARVKASEARRTAAMLGEVYDRGGEVPRGPDDVETWGRVLWYDPDDDLQREVLAPGAVESAADAGREVIAVPCSTRDAPPAWLRDLPGVSPGAWTVPTLYVRGDDGPRVSVGVGEVRAWLTEHTPNGEVERLGHDAGFYGPDGWTRP
jgi:hypothetical protein